MLDGKVLSAPVIREPITGGSGQISGSFTVQDTVVLSALLRAGALLRSAYRYRRTYRWSGSGGDAIKIPDHRYRRLCACRGLHPAALWRSVPLRTLALLLHTLLTFCTEPYRGNSDIARYCRYHSRYWHRGRRQYSHQRTYS